MTIIKPVITEKSMYNATRGLYTFSVLPLASKSQIREAIETSFKVHVVDINSSLRHVPGKSTGSKRLQGNPSKAKFATVRLKKGETIDLFDLKESK